MESILFAVTMTAVVVYGVQVVGMFFNRSITMPVPALHLLGVQYTNTYISSPAIAYQVYFWANHFGLFG